VTEQGRDRQTDAALRVLAGAKGRMDGDEQAVLRALRGSAADVSLRLMESVELIHHLLRRSGDPQAELSACIQAVLDAEQRTSTEPD
jgi:hypothetical protein